MRSLTLSQQNSMQGGYPPENKTMARARASEDSTATVIRASHARGKYAVGGSGKKGFLTSNQKGSTSLSIGQTMKVSRATQAANKKTMPFASSALMAEE